ncbi:MAG: L-threonylcarbamoyladenylate synthase [Bacteroidota bacterium]
MLLRINPENPERRKINQVVETLSKGGIIIYPTDTVYGIGCDIHNQKAVERVCRIKGVNPRKVNLSFVCNDLSHLSDYAVPFETSIFKLMKASLPGPYTFILKANNNVPKLFKNNKKTVGIRIPDHPIAQDIVRGLGRPLLSTSLKIEDEILEYWNDPIDIYEYYQKLVDIVIDGGMGGLEPSTIVDFTGGSPDVIRAGAGDIALFE